MTKEEVNEKTSLCFLLNPNISEEEIKAAFHEGFRFGLHQERSGKFKNR